MSFVVDLNNIPSNIARRHDPNNLTTELHYAKLLMFIKEYLRTIVRGLCSTKKRYLVMMIMRIVVYETVPLKQCLVYSGVTVTKNMRNIIVPADNEHARNIYLK